MTHSIQVVLLLQPPLQCRVLPRVAHGLKGFTVLLPAGSTKTLRDQRGRTLQRMILMLGETRSFHKQPFQNIHVLRARRDSLSLPEFDQVLVVLVPGEVVFLHIFHLQLDNRLLSVEAPSYSLMCPLNSECASFCIDLDYKP